VILYILELLFVGILIIIAKSWVTTLNSFQVMITQIDRIFANLNNIFQQRIVILNAMENILKKYSSHESTTFVDTAKARTGLLNLESSEQIKLVQKIDDSFIRINAVVEQNPNLKADILFQSFFGEDSITEVEKRFRGNILLYNQQIQQYNQKVKCFPTNIVAKVHGFSIKEQFTLKASFDDDYQPGKIFKEYETK